MTWTILRHSFIMRYPHTADKERSRTVSHRAAGQARRAVRNGLPHALIPAAAAALAALAGAAAVAAVAATMRKLDALRVCV
jgi:hypothetical protein